MQSDQSGAERPKSRFVEYALWRNAPQSILNKTTFRSLWLRSRSHCLSPSGSMRLNRRLQQRKLVAIGVLEDGLYTIQLLCRGTQKLDATCAKHLICLATIIGSKNPKCSLTNTLH